MSRTSVLGVCVGLLLIRCAVPVSAQQAAVVSNANRNAVVPPLVSFSGVLANENGKPLSGVVGVTFALYKESQGGAPLWLETQNVYPDKTSHYTVLLGSTTSTGLPSDLFEAGEARWLGVQIQGQAEQPRLSLSSVPYALKAADAQTVGGLPASAFVLAAPPTSTGGTTSGTATPQPQATGTTPVTTAGGTVNKLAKFDATADITNSLIFDNGTNVGIGNTAPAAKLDVTGTATVRGLLSLPATGTATATAGKNSQPIKLTASAFNSGTGTAAAQNFQWQAEPVGNNTSTTSGTLNLLYATGSNTLAETGLKIASNGHITFASGQTFPGTGNGTITGVTAGTDLTGGGTSGKVTLNLDTTKVPLLAVANTFTGNQTVNGNVSATGLVTGTAFNIGSNVFGWGSYANYDAFLGFAGSSANTGQYNTASGVQALLSNTTGMWNTADGSGALINNTTGNYDTATGAWTLAANTTGNSNTATGSGTLNANTTGGDNTATGTWALGKNTTGNDNTADGANTLSANTTGYDNTASGSGALFANTTGQSNTAEGTYALTTNTTGGTNTASGFSALNLNTTGSWNTAGGAFALNNNTTGGANTAYGNQALYYNTTGNGNTALGNRAGPDQNSTNLSNSTAIGASAVVSASNALVLGCVNGVNNCPAAVNVGIGTAKPAYTLDVQGTGNFTGLVKFASGQTFPGTGTITGVTTAAGSGLTGGGTSGTLNLSLLATCSANQVLQWTGSAWACGNSGGTITGVTAGTDLTGGGTSGNITLNLDTTKVPQLATANTFTGAQTVSNNVTVTAAGTTLTASGGTTGVSATGSSYGVLGQASTGTGVYATGAQGVEGVSTNGSWAALGTSWTSHSKTYAVGMRGAGNDYGVMGSGGNGVGIGVEGDGPSGGQGQLGTTVVGSAAGVYGNGNGYGVYGSSASSSGFGVYGYSGGTGVYGSTVGNNMAVVSGAGVAGSGSTYGVYGNGTGYGVYGESDTATGYGVYGANNYSPGGVGVRGYSYSGIGVEGTSISGTAGVFDGNVTVTGTLTKAHGSFKIDHPLDPANKYLYHSFVESPDMMNIYNGNVVLGGEGTAWVTLPDYFEALNGDFRYQLTAVGAPGPNLYIAQEIANNRFQIAGGTPGARVSWQVTGIRHDSYAKAHPIVPEVEKTGDERGRYLHPIEHGQPRSMGIYESRRANMLMRHQQDQPQPPTQ